MNANRRAVQLQRLLPRMKSGTMLANAAVVCPEGEALLSLLDILTDQQPQLIKYAVLIHYGRGRAITIFSSSL